MGATSERSRNSEATMVENTLLHRILSALPHHTEPGLRLALWNGMERVLGAGPTVTVRLNHPRALRYLFPPSLDNLAEGYVQGHFEVQGSVKDIIAAAAGLARAKVPMAGRFGRLLQSAQHDRDVDARSIAHHYDVSNDFYALWLDPRMVYSCAYFSAPTLTLEQAQLAKIDHILTKIMLEPGQTLLDIGCGWSALAMRAADKFGARVVGITLSQNQFLLARERVAQAGLQDRVDIRLQDYRDVKGSFDRITSVGMFEHVGLKHLQDYFSHMRALLADGGLVMNHGITTTDPDSGGAPLGAGAFIGKYVFPHGELPHLSLALHDMQAAGLEVLDVENLRRHYAHTLTLWTENYEAHATEIRATVDETRFRVWRIYLSGCAHAFQQNWVSLHQILACKSGADERLNPTPWTRNWMYA
jgi:cyclopropane-fatty-acyl-phospholipid synthase